MSAEIVTPWPRRPWRSREAGSRCHGAGARHRVPGRAPRRPGRVRRQRWRAHGQQVRRAAHPPLAVWRPASSAAHSEADARAYLKGILDYWQWETDSLLNLLTEREEVFKRLARWGARCCCAQWRWNAHRPLHTAPAVTVFSGWRTARWVVGVAVAVARSAGPALTGAPSLQTILDLDEKIPERSALQSRMVVRCGGGSGVSYSAQLADHHDRAGSC
jgi:hypothetical protein